MPLIKYWDVKIPMIGIKKIKLEIIIFKMQKLRKKEAINSNLNI